MMTKEQATKLAGKYEEIYNYYDKECNKAWKAVAQFLCAKICNLTAEKLYNLTSIEEWREKAVSDAIVVAYFGRKLKPEKYAQLRELAMETFKSFEVGFGDCGD